LSNVAFCPGPWAFDNLAGYRHLTRVDIGANTLVDALRLALRDPQTPKRPLPQGEFGVVSIHRFENVFRRHQLTRILKLLEHIAISYALVLVLHPATERNLRRFGLFPKLQESERFILWPRVGYRQFITLVSRAQFVVTDGGGNQEELSYMGIPTLLMRAATERMEGIGANAVLCGYEIRAVDDFLSRVRRHDFPKFWLEEGRPSAKLVDALLTGYAPGYGG
jgi:UDP-N-acetylglucosamine 2-epimerase (non-hydrolysing)